MTREQKIYWSVVALIGLLVGGLMLSGPVEQQLAPEPVAAWVALQPEGSEVAQTGRIELSAGTGFELHAVLEAKDWSGKTVYFTEADRLVIEGEEIPADLLRALDPQRGAQNPLVHGGGVLAFLASKRPRARGVSSFREVFRSDWARAWSIPGDLQPSRERQEVRDMVTGLPRFGTQRFHVRIEMFGPKSSITPEVRLRSPQATDLPEKVTVPDGDRVSARRAGGSVPGLRLEPDRGGAAGARCSAADCWPNGRAIAWPSPA